MSTDYIQEAVTDYLISLQGKILGPSQFLTGTEQQIAGTYPICLSCIFYVYLIVFQSKYFLLTYIPIHQFSLYFGLICCIQ